jgi:hypothetical protein
MPDGETGEPDANQLKILARGLIGEQSTVTLATCGQNGPWAAPVYYVFLKSAFYFFFGLPLPVILWKPWKGGRLRARSTVSQRGGRRFAAFR